MSQAIFGGLVTEVREEKGISRSKLCEIMGYKTSGAVTRLEQSDNPTLEQIRKSAQALEVPVSRLIPELAEKPAQNVTRRFSKAFLAVLVFLIAGIFTLGLYAVNVKNSAIRKQSDLLFGMGAKYYPSVEAKIEPEGARQCFGRLTEAEQMQANSNLFAYLRHVKRVREGGFIQSYKQISTWYCKSWRNSYPIKTDG